MKHVITSLSLSDLVKRGATVDILLGISAHNLVIIGCWGLGQIAKVCTLPCSYTLVNSNSNFNTLIDGVILVINMHPSLLYLRSIKLHIDDAAFHITYVIFHEMTKTIDDKLTYWF